MIVKQVCPHCGSENTVKNGRAYKGAQKYACKDCARYGTLHAQQGYAETTREQVKRAVLERISLRGRVLAASVRCASLMFLVMVSQHRICSGVLT